MSTMTISDLRTKRAETWEKAKAFLDERRDLETGCLSAEDDQTYARMETEIDKLTNEIARAERALRRDADLARATNQPLTSMPGITIHDDDDTKPKAPRASAAYKRAFWDAMRLNASPLEVRIALSEGVDTEGGYLVPDEFERTLVQSLADQNVMRGLAKVIQTTSGDRKIPVVSTHGTAGWLDEGKPYTESDEVFSQVTLSAFKLGTFLKISEELLNDAAFDVEAYLASEFARRIGAAEEAAFLVGTGTGQPTGIFTTGGGQAGVTTAKPTDISADELIDLHYSLRAPYRKNAVWLMNDSTVKTVRKLKDAHGQYLWQPALTAGSPDLILGKPVHTSAFVPEIKASAKTVAFGDLGYYWIADRQGRSFKRLNELFATSGQVGFLASQRLDGKLVLPEAVKVLTQKATA